MSDTVQPYAISQQFAGKKQVAYALVGIPDLLRIEDADDIELFRLPPVDDGGAYRHAAYWTALAARLLDNRTLAATAGTYAAWSTPYIAGSISYSNASKILAGAANEVQKAVLSAQNTRFDSGRVSQAARVQAQLLAYAVPTAIERAQEGDSGPLAEMRRLSQAMEEIGKLATAAIIIVGIGSLAALAWGISRWLRTRKHR